MNEKTIEKSFDEYMKRIIQKIICLITKEKSSTTNIAISQTAWNTI